MCGMAKYSELTMREDWGEPVAWESHPGTRLKGKCDRWAVWDGGGLYKWGADGPD